MHIIPRVSPPTPRSSLGENTVAAVTLSLGFGKPRTKFTRLASAAFIGLQLQTGNCCHASPVQVGQVHFLFERWQPIRAENWRLNAFASVYFAGASMTTSRSSCYVHTRTHLYLRTSIVAHSISLKFSNVSFSLMIFHRHFLVAQTVRLDSDPFQRSTLAFTQIST